MRKHQKSWLRREIERKLFLRFHFFEDGWELNKEFMRWKLKNYWGYITCLRHSGLPWYWAIPCFFLYVCLLPCIVLVIMPIDVLKTPFITRFGMRQKYALMRYKSDVFGIRDINDPTDYYMYLERVKLTADK